LYQATIKEVIEVADKSRADYFRERRKQKETKAFYVEVDQKKLENLEGKLSKKKQTKKEWLNEKIEKDPTKGGCVRGSTVSKRVLLWESS